MPADVVTRTRIEIECICMWIRRRHRLQPLPGKFVEPGQKSRRSIQLPEAGRSRIETMSADAAALFMTRQIIPVHGVAEVRHGSHQSLRRLLVKKILMVEERTLRNKRAPAGLGVDLQQTRGHLRFHEAYCTAPDDRCGVAVAMPFSTRRCSTITQRA